MQETQIPEALKLTERRAAHLSEDVLLPSASEIQQQPGRG